MLHFDTNNPSNTDTNTSSKSLFAFKPRQVLLAERNTRSKMTAVALKEENSSKITSLTPELKGIFHRSILHYLHRNGYSRTLKRFQSEAQIQSDTWKVSSLHLEDVFCKYSACSADSNLNTSKKPVLGNDEVIKKANVCATDEETTSKKKKKGTIESDNSAIEDQSEVIDKKMVQSGKNCGQISDIIVHELEAKPKKKKTKHDVDSSSQAQEAKSDLLKKPVDGTINGLKIDDSTKKTKDKKKKGTVESASCAIENQSNVTNKKIVESGQNCGQISEDIIVNELETKPKKKKTKHDSNSPGAAEVKSDVSKKPVDDTINGLEMDESTKKKKDKKKKGTVESGNGAFKDQSKVTDKKVVESGKNCSQILEDIIVNERETKPKKKKMKPDLDSAGQAEEAKSAVLKKPIDDTINGLDIDDLTKKTKDKKKKSVQQDKAEPSTTNENEFITEVAQKERKTKKKSNTHSAVEDYQVNPVRIEAENETSQPDVSRKEKKSSKKRKRSLSDENVHLSTEMTISEESKRQKTETSKEEKNKKEGSKVNEINAQETSNKQLDGQENGKLESGAQKSMTKQSNSSAEPKTVNAFQRVKIDRVEFAHEKLQDNSYWAKDGAEIGYGAKAQEVLGQVRGRDFRHEKTKKKRGSYRGGLIDLQSHSVKFNYSDD